MNCAEVRKYLSEFLDGSLDIEHTEEIEDHLSACALCSEEMASLAECHRLVSGLPAVEPPVGFTTRVMVEVRETANPPNLWERLFLPLRIKIPLQATALALIAVLAAYIYQKELTRQESGVTFSQSSFKKQEETHGLTPSVAQGPTAPSMTKQVIEETKARVKELRDSAQLKEPQSIPKAEEQNKGIAGSQHEAPSKSQAQNQVRPPATLTPTPLQEKPSVASEATSPRLEQSSPPAQAKTDPAPGPQSEKEDASRAAAGTAKPLLTPEARGPRGSAPSSLSALRSGTVVGVAAPADQELAVRLKEPGRDDKASADRLASADSQSERSSLTSQEEAKTFDQARERAIQTGESQTVWVTIARDQYELFKKQLVHMGNIERESSTSVPKKDAVAKSSDRLRIKVTLLPPLPSGSPRPPEPSSR